MSRTIRDDRIVSSQDRGDRGVEQDAARQETGLASEVEALLRSEFEQVALPNPPKLAGYHLCWLSTTSSYDTIAKRMRLGYEPVKPSEMPGFDTGNKPNAAFDGAISCNEMVLFKIKEEVYQQIMRIFHHQKPMEDEDGIYQGILAQNQATDSSGRPVGYVEGDGFDLLRQSVEKARRIVPHY